MAGSDKQDFVYLAKEDVYRCPAGEKLTYSYTNEESGRTLCHYWTGACRHCPLKSQCAKANERRIKRWEHEHFTPLKGPAEGRSDPNGNNRPTSPNRDPSGTTSAF